LAAYALTAIDIASQHELALLVAVGRWDIVILLLRAIRPRSLRANCGRTRNGRKADFAGSLLLGSNIWALHDLTGITCTGSRLGL